MPWCEKLRKHLTFDCIELQGFEADDLIATYTKEALNEGAEVTIVSSDKDLMQLVTERVTMFDSFKNRRIGPEQVQEKFGVYPEKVVDVQSLAGDSTDNVPGVPGIGIKTAAQLIQEYGDLDTLLARASEIKQNKRRENLIEHADKARLSRELVRLRDDVPLTIPLSQLERRQPDLEHLERFLTEQGFKSILARLQSRSTKARERSSASPNPQTTSPSSPPLIRKRRNPLSLKNLSQPHYELVQTVEALQLWIDKAMQQGLVAVDTETTSLDQTRAELVGISLSLHPGNACYIPVGHVAPGAATSMDLLEQANRRNLKGHSKFRFKPCSNMLRPLLSDPSVLKVGHNIKYDMVVLGPLWHHCFAGR